MFSNQAQANFENFESIEDDLFVRWNSIICRITVVEPRTIFEKRKIASLKYDLNSSISTKYNWKPKSGIQHIKLIIYKFYKVRILIKELDTVLIIFLLTCRSTLYQRITVISFGAVIQIIWFDIISIQLPIGWVNS